MYTFNAIFLVKMNTKYKHMSTYAFYHSLFFIVKRKPKPLVNVFPRTNLFAFLLGNIIYHTVVRMFIVHVSALIYRHHRTHTHAQ